LVDFLAIRSFVLFTKKFHKKANDKKTKMVDFSEIRSFVFFTKKLHKKANDKKTKKQFYHLKIKIRKYVITSDLKDKKTKESTDSFRFIVLNTSAIGKIYSA